MPLIIEDGSGKVDSESFCDVAFADAYHLSMANDAWAAVVNKEAMLRRAAIYMQQTYRLRWHGTRVSDTQAMDWPRYSVERTDSGLWRNGFAVNIGNLSLGSYYASNIVPKEVMQAQAELALKASAGELLADVEPPVASEQVGPIAVSYFQGATQIKKFVAVDRLLAPFMQNTSNIRMMRA
jgi:hypothetical protein